MAYLPKDIVKYIFEFCSPREQVEMVDSKIFNLTSKHITLQFVLTAMDMKKSSIVLKCMEKKSWSVDEYKIMFDYMFRVYYAIENYVKLCIYNKIKSELLPIYVHIFENYSMNLNDIYNIKMLFDVEYWKQEYTTNCKTPTTGDIMFYLGELIYL
jgi:hypothetical protein